MKIIKKLISLFPTLKSEKTGSEEDKKIDFSKIGKTLIAIVNLPPRAMMGIDSCGMILSAICKEGDEERLNLLIVDNNIPAGAKLY